MGNYILQNLLGSELDDVINTIGGEVNDGDSIILIDAKFLSIFLFAKVVSFTLLC